MFLGVVAVLIIVPAYVLFIRDDESPPSDSELLGAAADPWGNQRVGFEGAITINRKDFGLNWNAALEAGGFLVGDEVKIEVSLQAIGQ